MLFEDFERTDHGRANIDETKFEFLNRSARSQASEARERIELLLSEYPPAGLNHLLARFRSDNQNFHGALFELVTRRMFMGLGCQVEVCDVDNSQARPDFLVRYGGKRCYVEATVVDPKSGTLGSNVHELDVIDKLDTLGGRGFGLAVETEGTLTKFLSKGRITSRFLKLIEENNPSDLSRYPYSWNRSNGPSAQIREGDWQLTGHLIAIDSDRFVHEQLVGGTIINPEKPIGQRVTDKAKKYRDLDAPLVITVNARDLVFDIKHDAIDALFGKVVRRITTDNRSVPSTIIQEETFRQPGGIWIDKGGKERYTRLKALILFERLDPFKLTAPMMVYFNPYVEVGGLPDVMHRLPHAIDRLPHAIDGGDRIEFVCGESLENLLFGESG